MKGQTQC